MYRLIVESLLGLNLEAGKLRIAPCLPKEWKSFKLHYRYGETVYHIEVSQSGAGGPDAPRVLLDGVEQHDIVIKLQDDKREHRIEVQMAGSNHTAPPVPAAATV